MVSIRDKMQVVYKKMTGDGAKSNMAKWNLFSGIQFKHVKNCLLFIYNALIWHVLIRLRRLLVGDEM